MILTCPSCGTQYVVKDGTIPPEGRQVRCAACKHSWHQDPGEGGEAAPGGSAEPEAGEPAYEATAEPSAFEESEAAEADGSAEASEETIVDGDEGLAEAASIEPRSGPEAEERAYEEAVIEGAADLPEARDPLAETEGTPRAAQDWREPPEAEAAADMFSPFAEEDEEPRGRSGSRTILVVAVAIVLLAALFWFFAPADVKARLGLASAADSPLQVSNPPHVERLQLASGNELLTVSGRVINPTGHEQDVPPLQAKLTNQAGKLVYSWTIAPPARSLAAGASASFNSAEVNVPPGGEYLTITVGQKA
ncbi:MJ0042-type zinc finger domain-containing protein [Sphingomonas sp.]|uniref:MJ0042-type zinc finger domain-containing protein n=1 Tax=Sphingomonas sp. TaxID=28214 RepID=UPI00389E2DE5